VVMMMMMMMMMMTFMIMESIRLFFCVHSTNCPVASGGKCDSVYHFALRNFLLYFNCPVQVICTERGYFARINCSTNEGALEHLTPNHLV